LKELFEKLIGFIDVKSIETTGFKVILAIAVVLLTLWLVRKVSNYIDHHMTHDNDNFFDDQVARNYKITAKIVIMTLGILLALHVLGIDMVSVFTGGGMFAVAMAFVMKNFVENYISGIILRVQKTIKPGDVLEMSGDHKIVRVETIGMNSTIVRMKDEKDVVIPNYELIQNKISNYTYSNSLCRIEAKVGVAYSSDLDEVQKVLESVCAHCDWKSPQHEISVILSGFGDSAINYKVRIWIDDPWLSTQQLALLNLAIWRELKEADITIAFPQLDVHFDESFKG
jgi:small-conductance mechanosensitive channel